MGRSSRSLSSTPCVPRRPLPAVALPARVLSRVRLSVALHCVNAVCAWDVLLPPDAASTQAGIQGVRADSAPHPTPPPFPHPCLPCVVWQAANSELGDCFFAWVPADAPSPYPEDESVVVPLYSSVRRAPPARCHLACACCASCPLSLFAASHRRFHRVTPRRLRSALCPAPIPSALATARA